MSFDVDITCRFGALATGLRLHSDAPLTALVGPSGAGKTSVLNCIAGLLQPERGRIEVAGEVLFDAARGIDLPPHRRHAGYVFQDARLFPHLKVAANLAYGERLALPRQASSAAGLPDRAEIVDLLGIAPLLQRWPASLSGGEARRVAIARALLSAPRFLLLDEPTASLDERRVGAVLELVERIRDTLPIPILLVSHVRAQVDRLTDAVFVLDHQQVG